MIRYPNRSLSGWQGQINFKSPHWSGLAAWYPLRDTGGGVNDFKRRTYDAYAASANRPTFGALNAETGVHVAFATASYTDANRDYQPITSVSLGTEHTMAYWSYYVNYSAQVYGGVTLGYTNDYYFDWISGSTRYAAFGTANLASTTSNLVKSTWQHLGIVRNGTSVQFYLNGMPDGSVQTLGTNNAVTITLIGAATTVANSYYGYNGRLADVRMYSRALNAAEMWSLYDPDTRWELYRPAPTQIWWIPPATTNIIPRIRHHMAQQGMA